MGKNTHRMLLIDPEKREITEHQVLADGHAMSAMIDGHMGDAFRLADHEGSYDYGFVDDMGLTKEEPVFAFQFLGRADPIAGKCLVYGAEKLGGETCDAKFPLSTLNAVVRWLGLIEARVEWTTNERGQSAEIKWKQVS